MFHWLYVAIHLLNEALAARRDARVRFLNAQVRILRRKLGGNRVVPSPEDRACLLAIGAELDHHVTDLIGIVTAKTYHRWVVEQRQGREPKRAGRPRLGRNTRQLVARLARENIGWGYKRIIGELHKLRIRLGRSSVQRILREEGLVPGPVQRRRAGETPWRKFIRLHVDTLVACHFFTKNVITRLGTQVAFCLALIHIGTRKVFLSPATYEPNDRWVRQQIRNMTMWLDEQGLKARFLLHDHDGKFSSAKFRDLLRSEGIQEVRSPVLAPDGNAFIESWIGQFKREALNHFLCFGLHHLDHIGHEYVRFHNEHRPHQGLDNRTIPAAERMRLRCSTVPTMYRLDPSDASVSSAGCSGTIPATQLDHRLPEVLAASQTVLNEAIMVACVDGHIDYNARPCFWRSRFLSRRQSRIPHALVPPHDDREPADILGPLWDSTTRYMHIYDRRKGNGDPLAQHVSGLMLHPSVGEMISETVVIQGHAIRFGTVDLAASATEIREQLLRAIEIPAVLCPGPAAGLCNNRA